MDYYDFGITGMLIPKPLLENAQGVFFKPEPASRRIAQILGFVSKIFARWNARVEDIDFDNHQTIEDSDAVDEAEFISDFIGKDVVKTINNEIITNIKRIKN